MDEPLMTITTAPEPAAYRERVERILEAALAGGEEEIDYRQALLALMVAVELVAEDAPSSVYWQAIAFAPGCAVAMRQEAEAALDQAELE